MSNIAPHQKAAIEAAASSVAGAQLAVESAQKAHSQTTEKADGIRDRLSAVRAQIARIRTESEGAELSDAQAGRVHLLTLDETDLAGHLATAERAVVESRGAVDAAAARHGAALQAMEVAKRAVRSEAMRQRVAELERLLVIAVDEGFKEHVAAGGVRHFPAYWAASEGLRRAVTWGTPPSGITGVIPGMGV